MFAESCILDLEAVPWSYSGSTILKFLFLSVFVFAKET